MSQTLASGITGAAPIWNKITKLMLAKNKNEKMELPSDVVTKPCNGYIEYFIKGTESLTSCSAYLASPSAALSPPTQ